MDHSAIRQDRPDPQLRLRDVPLRQTVELVRIDLPPHDAEPLLDRGQLPGCSLCPVRRTPFGDPIVSLNGTLLALRKETAECLCVRLLEPAAED